MPNRAERRARKTAEGLALLALLAALSTNDDTRTELIDHDHEGKRLAAGIVIAARSEDEQTTTITDVLNRLDGDDRVAALVWATRYLGSYITVLLNRTDELEQDFPAGETTRDAITEIAREIIADTTPKENA